MRNLPQPVPGHELQWVLAVATLLVLVGWFMKDTFFGAAGRLALSFGLLGFCLAAGLHVGLGWSP